MKKPRFISQYLVLKDLINNIDVRRFNDSIVYLVGRIENIKLWLKSKGIQFKEDARSNSRFANYTTLSLNSIFNAIIPHEYNRTKKQRKRTFTTNLK